MPAYRGGHVVLGLMPLPHIVKEFSGKLDAHQVEVGVARGIFKDHYIPMFLQAPDRKRELCILGKAVNQNLVVA